MLQQMAGLAMDRDGDAGPDQLVHLDQFVAGRMARHVNAVAVFRDDVDALEDQPVMERPDGKLVAVDDTRREDDRVTVAQVDLPMIAGGDAGERRARLPLAAGTDVEHLILGQLARLLGLEKRRQVA